MNISSKSEVLEVLNMEEQAFLKDVMPKARALYQSMGNRLIVTAMLGYTNICKNQCLYCGMRAGNNTLERYRIALPDVKASIQKAKDMGLNRIFFVAGDDPKYGFENILEFIRFAHELGFWVTFGAGELERDEFLRLKEAGVSEYAMKFEMSDRKTFNRLNPSTDFAHRMRCIGWIKEMGFALASGNIIDYPGQTVEQLADDIMLMKELEISWAPVIPYMPAKNTPLALEGGPGRLEMLYKEIALLRLMMPELNITAQQPGRDLSQGLAGKEGNIAALQAGANMLFADLLPDAMAKNFSVVDNRSSLDLQKAREIAQETGMIL